MKKNNEYHAHNFYNVGNGLYDIIVSSVGDKKLEYGNQALSYYEKALQYDNNADHRERILHNKAIIEELLKDNENEDTNESNGNEGDENQNTQKDNSQQDGSEQGESNQEQENTTDQGEESGHDTSAQQEGLSQEQIQQLEQYQKILEEQQQANQQYFSPIPSSIGNQPQSLLDAFFGDQDGLSKQLPNTEGQKDR